MRDAESPAREQDPKCGMSTTEPLQADRRTKKSQEDGITINLTRRAIQN